MHLLEHSSANPVIRNTSQVSGDLDDCDGVPVSLVGNEECGMWSTKIQEGHQILLLPVYRFIDVGGYKLLNNWLTYSKTTNNIPLLQQILLTLQHLPLTVDHLKQVPSVFPTSVPLLWLSTDSE